MTFNDILSSELITNTTEFSLTDTLISMFFAFAIGLFIFLIYKKTFSGVMYSSGFAMTMVGLSMVTTLVIMAVTSNIVLSLGMVGALSIVRFRAAIKEPMEIVFLFWSLATGIIIGAGLIPLAVVGAVIVGIVLLIFANRKSHTNPYIVVLSCDSDAGEKEALELLGASVEKYVVKTKTVNPGGIEITAEIRVKDAGTEFINKLCSVNGVENASLISYNGEYMS